MEKFLLKLSPSARKELAALLAEDGERLVAELVLRLEALGGGKFARSLPDEHVDRRSPRDSTSALPSPARPRPRQWKLVDRISFERSFASDEVPVEHFDDIPIYETRDADGLHRIALGAPRERAQLYGRERGWFSAWSVVNGTPRQLRAVFVDCDDFEQSSERAAVIYGLAGDGRKAFPPDRRDELPAMYQSALVEVQRDRCQGPYAKNRLALIASADQVDLMLDHSLRQAKLRD